MRTMVYLIPQGVLANPQVPTLAEILKHGIPLTGATWTGTTFRG